MNIQIFGTNVIFVKEKEHQLYDDCKDYYSKAYITYRDVKCFILILKDMCNENSFTINVSGSCSTKNKNRAEIFFNFSDIENLEKFQSVVSVAVESFVYLHEKSLNIDNNLTKTLVRGKEWIKSKNIGMNLVQVWDDKGAKSVEVLDNWLENRKIYLKEGYK